MALDYDQVEEIKQRLADRYTAAELVDLLDLPVEDIIEAYFDFILQFHPGLLEEVGVKPEDTETEEPEDD